jgi:SAM-dependent methyltransferase
MSTAVHSNGLGRTFLRAYLALRRRTIGRFLDPLGSRLFDRRHGTDTENDVVWDDLGIDEKDKKTASFYSPTRPGPFHIVMRALKIPTGGGFVDFGSGKGRVLLLAARYPFERITGVELSGKLCAIARKNVEIYRAKRPVDARIDVVEVNALEYPIDDRDNVFFFYNPFSMELVETVIKNIVASHDRRPRRTWLVFHNTGCLHMLTGHPLFEDLGEFDFWGPGRYFHVYASR